MDELVEKLRSALNGSGIEILFGPAFMEQLENNRFEKRDKQACVNAAISLIKNPRNPGLNFEQLGGGKNANHYSIRGSQELRVILAVEKNGKDRVLFANMGHHEDMYRWSAGRDGRSDLNDRRNLVPVTGKKHGSDSGKTEDALNKALSGRFDLWQLFLPEDMKNLATGKSAGASRVRGAAGTGKSVLALHRAKTLGERYKEETILFTTYSRSLANSMRHLFETFPDPPRNVEFRNVDQLVRMILPGDFELDDGQTFEEAFDESLDATVKRRFRKEYLKEEIENVIRGRDASREEYLDTDRFERLGRLKSLKRRDRELVWNLKEAWDSKLAARGLKTWPQLRIEALELLCGKNEPMYRAAIIDEAQDLSLVSMQLIRGLVCGARSEKVKDDAITMYDDTAQRFYVGGFLPRWVPIDVVGRSNTLAKNYRNRPEILYAAYVVRGDALLTRNDGDDGAAKRPEPVLPSGRKPKFVQVHGSERKFIRGEIDRMVKFGGLGHKDIAVLTHRNRDVNEMISELADAGVPCVNLYDLRNSQDASDRRGVHVGTFDRGKGLEFRAVFVFRVGETAFYEKKSAEDKGRLFELEDEPLEEEEIEARRLLVDRLYVGMTRARDSLYLVADERPVDRIEDAIEKNRVLDMKPEQVAQEWKSGKNRDNP